MAEQALYRKYRSADFSEVVGQEHITKTLVTAIASGRLSHAYLFTGPRGVGKTSVARLLARALNCVGEGARPCNKCQLCNAAINSSLDVVEMDAASNRSIDAVRELRDKVNLAPAIGKYKVYIIDEVHMLTAEAFNALLKTLEEPPAHAVFILATTEAHKLPETIISRTQRFNFKPIATADIISHLDTIAASEKIEVEPEALQIIATASRGGFRDAISMLDQMASGGERPVSAATVRALMGLSDSEAIGSLSQAIVAGNAKTAIEALEQLLEQGAQPGQVALQLTDQWREILLASVGAAKGDDELVRQLAAQISAGRIATIVESLLEVTRSHWPREALEVALVRLTIASPTAEVTSAPVAAQPTPPVASKAAAKPTPAAAKPEAKESPADSGLTLSGQLWPKVLVILKQKNNSLCTLLQMYPAEFGEDTINIQSRFNFHRDLLNQPQNRQAIEAAAQKVYGRAVAVNAVTNEVAAPAAPRNQPDPASELMSSALEILGGEIVEGEL